MTMFDGKVVNALTDTKSTQSCNVCDAKPSEMNNVKVIRKKKVNEYALSLGLSTLHCWLRTFEYICHLGYKMDIKKFMKKTKEEKNSVADRKKHIQDQFRKNSVSQQMFQNRDLETLMMVTLQEQLLKMQKFLLRSLVLTQR